jgi:hypothetical protein
LVTALFHITQVQAQTNESIGKSMVDKLLENKIK